VVAGRLPGHEPRAEALLDERLKEHLAWHCRTQLPGYLDWLDRVQGMVASDPSPTGPATARARQAIGRVAEQITPSASELLRGMSDAQVAEMRQAFRGHRQAPASLRPDAAA
jgi:hypothetical protein